jgi:hypothetical protein
MPDPGMGEFIMAVRAIFAILMALAPALAVIFAEPARADSVITSSFDTQVAHPGDTVTLNVTFTNPETVDVIFTYLSVNWTWETVSDGTKFSTTGCTGQLSLCDGHALNYTAPIAPGATRTATLTNVIAADSPCGESTNLSFFFYSYRESSAGAFDLIENSPTVTVLC